MLKARIDCKPFIKWVGGKRQLLSVIEDRLPAEEIYAGNLSYAEPFVGGGAVLFHLLNKTEIPYTIVNDLNQKLINTYSSVRDNTASLISYLQFFEKEYKQGSLDDKKMYYLAQRERFNQGNLSQDEQSALLMFLNRTCFNGLYRENSKGGFNVPFGRNENPQICCDELLYADAVALKNTKLLCGDFSETVNHLKGTTFFYLDPPYKPISNTSSFNDYVKTPFDDAEQIRLAEFCRELDKQGHLFLLSNSDPGENFFDNLYKGFRIERVKAKRCVNANGAKRGALDEVLISNY